MIPSLSFHGEPFLFASGDNVIDLETVRAINMEWPDNPWQNHHHEHSQKRGCSQNLGPVTRTVLERFNSPSFIAALGRAFGLNGLVADESLFGGGLHESFAGGFLGIHADFNLHPETKLIRRLNLLLFLNEDWREEYGGNLELWGGEKCVKSIAPIAGRCVIFETTKRSFHGHPTPMTCGDRSRRSIALYYYSPVQPGETIVEHSTLYLGDEEKWPVGV